MPERKYALSLEMLEWPETKALFTRLGIHLDDRIFHCARRLIIDADFGHEVVVTAEWVGEDNDEADDAPPT